MQCPTCQRRVRVGRDDLYVRRTGVLAHVICPGRPAPVTASGGCGATGRVGARCTLPGGHRGDHYDAVHDESWFRIGGTVSTYKGLPVTLPRNTTRTKSPYITSRAARIADESVSGPPPGQPRALAYLRRLVTAKGPAWYVEAAETKRIVFAAMSGASASMWARANRYRIVRAPDQDEIPALSLDWTGTTTGKGGSVPVSH